MDRSGVRTAVLNNRSGFTQPEDGVDFIIVGGVAAGIHGALRTTLDWKAIQWPGPLSDPAF
jgi:hypothetical protein